MRALALMLCLTLPLNTWAAIDANNYPLSWPSKSILTTQCTVVLEDRWKHLPLGNLGKPRPDVPRLSGSSSLPPAGSGRWTRREAKS
eukprot:3940942-Rhodomonas_salina.1